jgi:hypothetical protein
MEKKEKASLPEGITQEQVKAWKERYGEGKVKLATLLGDEGNELGEVVVRAPGRKEIGEFEKWVDRNPDKAKEILVNTCLLTHKDEVKANEDMFLAAFDAIAKLIPIGKSVIKNL